MPYSYQSKSSASAPSFAGKSSAESPSFAAKTGPESRYGSGVYGQATYGGVSNPNPAVFSYQTKSSP